MKAPGWALAILATSTAAFLWSSTGVTAGMCYGTGACNLRCCDAGGTSCSDTPMNNCAQCNAGAYCWQGTCMGGFPPECIDGGVDGGLDAGSGGLDAGTDGGSGAMDAGPDAGDAGAGGDAGLDAGRDAGSGEVINPFGCSCGAGSGALWSAAFAVLLGLLFRRSHGNA